MKMKTIVKIILRARGGAVVALWPALALAWASGATQAQSFGSGVRGQVLDPNHAAIPDATVRIDPAVMTGSLLTNGDGEFTLKLPPGNYTLHVAANGFDQASQRITVTTGKFESLQLVLAPATATAMVNVLTTDAFGYRSEALSSATKTLTPLRDVPQSITVVSNQQIKDQSMASIADVVNYVPGITSHQGENNRDQLVIRGNSSSADFFLNGVRDDVQYYRDLYNVERVEALKGPNAMMFGRGGGGGVINRVTKEAGFTPLREFSLLGGSFGN